MKKLLTFLLLTTPLFSSLGEIAIEVEGKKAKVFVEGKFNYSLSKKSSPPQLLVMIPKEPYPYGTKKVIKEKAITVTANKKNGGTMLVISPGTDFSYEDYWGAGYLVILLTLKEKPPTPSTPKVKKTVEKVVPPPKPKREEKGKLFIIVDGAPKSLIYKALSKLTGKKLNEDTTSKRITLHMENTTLDAILKELKKK